MKKIKQLLDFFDEEPRIKYAVFSIIIFALIFGFYALISVNL